MDEKSLEQLEELTLTCLSLLNTRTISHTFLCVVSYGCLYLPVLKKKKVVEET
jgi:hypothetical protein